MILVHSKDNRYNIDRNSVFFHHAFHPISQNFPIHPLFKMFEMFVFRNRHIAIHDWNDKQAQKKNGENINGSHNTKFF